MRYYDIEYEYVIPEYGSITMSIDETMSQEEIEAEAVTKLTQMFPDIEDVKVTATKMVDPI